MSLRCGNCSAAFFSQKLLDRHQQKCSSLAGKTRFNVRVRVPEEDEASPAPPPPPPPPPPAERPPAAASATAAVVDTADEADVAASSDAGAAGHGGSNVENVSPSGHQARHLHSQPHQQQQQQPVPPAGRLLRVDIPLRSPDCRRRVACNACGKLFTGQRCRNWLVDHLRVEHLDQPPHSCPHCGALFVYFDTLQEHVTATHSAGGSGGGAKASLERQQRQQQQQVEEEEEGQQQQQQQHAQENPGEGYAYCCGLCNETYADLPRLLKHFADTHPEFASPDEIVAAATAPMLQQQQQQQQQQTLFACTLCSQSFDQLIAGQLHLQRQHPTEWRQIVCCPLCQLNCKTEALNVAHIRSVHAGGNDGDNSDVGCRLGCHQSASSKPLTGGQLCEHYVTAHVKPMSAFIVETTFAAAAAASAGAGDTLYECGGCKARYKDRALLEAHFQAGCPSLATTGAQDEADVAMGDGGVDDAYLHASVMSASISA